MATQVLVLTNLYAYEKGLNRALEAAKLAGAGMNVVFLIDPGSVADIVRDLGEEGWLGSAALRNLETSMLEGYRALAEDILQEAQSRFSQAGIAVETSVREMSPHKYIGDLLNQKSITVMVSGSPSLADKLEKVLGQIEWIEED